MFKISVLSIQVDGGMGGWREVDPTPFVEQLNCNISEPMILLAQAMQRAYGAKMGGSARFWRRNGCREALSIGTCSVI
jgi:hypothetical protein